ncbi:MAG: hypothetical protein M3O62_06340 [Pseudomonadota bacterium]|nr:hypothetical protein [Pseudomonadota bacterium]
MTIPTPASNYGRGKDANRDPITKAAGAHPVGTGVGAAAGGVVGAAAVGAATGTMVGGPIGTAAGLVVGAVAGGLAGKAVAEKIDPTVEDAYWREVYLNEPYYTSENSYEDYAPAYRVGYDGVVQHPDRTFEDAEVTLRSNYDEQRGTSKLSWENAKHATRAAWNRAVSAVKGEQHTR